MGAGLSQWSRGDLAPDGEQYPPRDPRRRTSRSLRRGGRREWSTTSSRSLRIRWRCVLSPGAQSEAFPIRICDQGPAKGRPGPRRTEQHGRNRSTHGPVAVELPSRLRRCGRWSPLVKDLPCQALGRLGALNAQATTLSDVMPAPTQISLPRLPGDVHREGMFTLCQRQD